MSKVKFDLARFNLVTPIVDRATATLPIERDQPSIITTNFSDTEIKVGEADFFMKLMEQNAPHQAILYYGLSAFLAASRSVTLFLQAEGATQPGFADWYAEIQEQLKSDDLAKFLKDARDISAHARYSKIKTVFDLPLGRDGKAWVHDPTEPIYVGFSFVDYLLENGFEKCRAHLATMKRIVTEAREKGFLPDTNARNVSLQMTDIGRERMFRPSAEP